MNRLINRENIFNEDYLKDIEWVEYENYNEETLYIERETFRHFEMLKAHLKIENILIDIKSAYRSIETQESIYLKTIQKYGQEYTEEHISLPGYSEHHLGVALDLIIYKDGKWLTERDELLKCIKEFSKIHNCLKYFGFILRYPKNKENITYKEYKPWHIRYVGEEISMHIETQTLEEYLNTKTNELFNEENHS